MRKDPLNSDWLTDDVDSFSPFFHVFRDKPMNHLDAMRLQAQNLEQAAHSHYDASRVTSKINSVATSLVASAIQSRNFTEMNTPQPKTPRSRSRSISVSRYVYVVLLIIIALNYLRF